MKRIVALLAAATSAHAALADDKPIPQGEETFKLNIGTILNQQDTTVRIDGPNGRGVEFGLEGIAGMKRDLNSTLASGTWRFSPNHRVGFQSFSTKRTAEKVIDQTLVIEDNVIPAGSTLHTEAKTSFLIANYQYSFIRNSNVELAGMAGIYGARFKFKFDTTTPPRNIDASAVAPLPVIGMSLDTFVNPRWTVSVFFEGLMLEVQNVKGRVHYAGLSTDYMLTKHFGVGLGYSFAGIGADVEDDGFRGSFDWSTKSLYAYAQLRF